MLHIDVDDKLQFSAQELIGKRIAAIGKSGSGKTHTLGVLLEEWFKSGFPATVVDPMGQFVALADYFPVLLVGRRQRAHLVVTVENVTQLADISLNERVSVVLDLSLYARDEMMAILDAYFHRLSQIVFPQEAPQPYMVAIDEAHLFAPQDGSSPMSAVLIDLAKLGRHKNLTTIVATQRAASIDKDFLTQSNMLFAHRMMLGVDTAILREQLPLPAKDLNAMMRKLQIGEALVIGDSEFIGFDQDYLDVQIRQREVGHVEAETLFEQSALRPIDERFLEALREQLSASVIEATVDSSDLLRHIADLRHQLANRPIERVEVKVEVPILAPEEATQLHDAACALVELGQRILGSLERVAYPLQIVTASEVSVIELPAPEPEAAPTVEEWKSPLQTERGLRRQQQEFEALLRDIKSMPGLHRKVLHYLIERSNRTFSVQELARFNGISTRHILDHPPTALIDMHLLKRTGRNAKDFQYQGTARLYLSEHFPDLNTEDLFDVLLKVSGR